MKPEANGQCKHRLEWRRRDGRNEGDGRGGLKLKRRFLSSVSLDPLHPTSAMERKKKELLSNSHHSKAHNFSTKFLTAALSSIWKSVRPTLNPLPSKAPLSA